MLKSLVSEMRFIQSFLVCVLVLFFYCNQYALCVWHFPGIILIGFAAGFEQCKEKYMYQITLNKKHM